MSDYRTSYVFIHWKHMRWSARWLWENKRIIIRARRIGNHWILEEWGAYGEQGESQP